MLRCYLNHETDTNPNNDHEVHREDCRLLPMMGYHLKSSERTISDITILLQELCKAGYLVSENKGRWTTYHLNNNLQGIEENKVDTFEGKVATSKERLSKGELEDLIIGTCTNEYKTLEEIALEVGKDIKSS